MESDKSKIFVGELIVNDLGYVCVVVELDDKFSVKIARDDNGVKVTRDISYSMALKGRRRYKKMSMGDN